MSESQARSDRQAQPEAGPGVVVTNPGSLRWKRNMAQALQADGQLARYVTTLAVGDEQRQRLTAKMPARVAGRVDSYLKLRDVPEGLPEQRITRLNPVPTIAQAAAFRALRSPRLRGPVLDACSAWFDRATARTLDRDCTTVIVPGDSGLETIRQAAKLGIRSILDWSTAHPQEMIDLMAQERQLVPEFADTLPDAGWSDAQLRRAKSEIAEADEVLVMSEFAKQTFINQGVDAGKLRVCNLGVDLEQFRPASEPRPVGGPLRVLFAGQITQVKGISYLLEAFREAAIPDCELVFMGIPVGPTKAWIDQPRVRYARPVPIHELREHYLAADVYVLPSIYEGFPQTAIIAMACGLPTIVSENTFGSDVIDDGVNGFVVPARDPGAIRERLLELSADSELRERIGAAARQRALNFSFEAYGQRICEIARNPL